MSTEKPTFKVRTEARCCSLGGEGRRWEQQKCSPTPPLPLPARFKLLHPLGQPMSALGPENKLSVAYTKRVRWQQDAPLPLGGCMKRPATSEAMANPEVILGKPVSEKCLIASSLLQLFCARHLVCCLFVMLYLDAESAK